MIYYQLDKDEFFSGAHTYEKTISGDKCEETDAYLTERRYVDHLTLRQGPEINGVVLKPP